MPSTVLGSIIQRVVVLVALCAGFDVLMRGAFVRRCDLRLSYCILMVDSICLILISPPASTISVPAQSRLAECSVWS
jgi:hypothetical protein